MADSKAAADDDDGAGDLARFSGTAESVTPLGRVIRQTVADPKELAKQAEARRLLDEARKGG